MEFVVGGIIILVLVAGLYILIQVNRKHRKENPIEENASAPASDCCGAHEVCELDEIKADESIIIYYDDEELDEFRNMNAEAYSNDQVELFREVLYTLKTAEIRYWLVSIERRKINLPTILVSEARMLMAEAL